ncbi:MAG: hydrogenase expression/formation protein [Gammaproteobacteria bacterium]|nr:MAG: hydrogenase expression/formation protein [Gammaproteobacteria bacterium]
MKDISIPVVVGPGSQPENPDGLNMAFMEMPQGMNTYAMPQIPEPEEAAHLSQGLMRARALLEALRGYRAGMPARVIELDGLDEENLAFVNQLLGEGEVSVKCEAPLEALIQESVLAGVWRVRYLDDAGQVVRDTMEVADVPGLVREQTFRDAQTELDTSALEIPENVYNAPPLLAEIADKLPEYHPGDEPHVINLSLLPHTEEDLLFLADALGIGPVVILSRGYGNCRISSTGTRHVWWVQYFNSQETLILNTLEISQVPEVACAADEDIEDSAQRLTEILSLYA